MSNMSTLQVREVFIMFQEKNKTHYVLTNIGVKTLMMKSISNMLIRKVRKNL
ncbi:hypothetical protein ACS0TY_022138 [Phlomoides rotata]